MRQHCKIRSQKNKDRNSWTGFFRYKISAIKYPCKYYNKISNLRDFGKIPDELSNHQFLKRECSMELITKKQTRSLILIFPALRFTFGFYKYVIGHSPNNASMILRAAQCRSAVVPQEPARTAEERQINRLTVHNVISITHDDEYNKENNIKFVSTKKPYIH